MVNLVRNMGNLGKGKSRISLLYMGKGKRTNYDIISQWFIVVHWLKNKSLDPFLRYATLLGWKDQYIENTISCPQTNYIAEPKLNQGIYPCQQK